MLILTRYLAREIIGPFLYGVSAFTALMAGFSLIPLVQQSGLDGQTVLRLTALTIPEQLALAFPMGILLGTLFTLGRLSGHSEIVAMRAGSLPPWRLMLPFLLLGVLASLASLYVSQTLVPAAHRAYDYELNLARGRAQPDVISHRNLPPEYDANGQLKRLVYVDKLDLTTNSITGARIQEFEQGQLVRTIEADEMIWDGKLWQFVRGQVVIINPDGRITMLTAQGGAVDYQPILPQPTAIAAEASKPANPDEMSWGEYRAYIEAKARRGEDIKQDLIDLYTRLAIPFACLALALVGTPLGIQSHRSGAALSFGLSILILVAYFFLLSFGQVLAKAGTLPPAVAVWSANIVLCVTGIGLFVYKMR